MNTLQIERLLKKNLKSKTIFKKSLCFGSVEKKNSVLWISWKNLLFCLLTSSTRTRVVNLENIGLQFGLPLHWSVSTLTWMPTPYRDGFTIAKLYKRTFPVFVLVIVSILFYFVVVAYLYMLLYPILRQT